MAGFGCPPRREFENRALQELQTKLSTLLHAVRHDHAAPALTGHAGRHYRVREWTSSRFGPVGRNAYRLDL